LHIGLALVHRRSIRLAALGKLKPKFMSSGEALERGCVVEESAAGLSENYHWKPSARRESWKFRRIHLLKVRPARVSVRFANRVALVFRRSIRLAVSEKLKPGGEALRSARRPEKT